MNSQFEVFDEHRNLFVYVCVLVDNVCVGILMRACVSPCHLFLFLIVFPPFQMFPFHITDS